MRVVIFTLSQQQSDLRQKTTLIGEVHLPFSSQPSLFLHQPAFSISSSASHSSFDRQPQDLMPFSRRDHPLPLLMNIPTNTVCHSQLIYGFILTQHEHQMCRSFLSLSFTPHIVCTIDFSVLCEISFVKLFKKVYEYCHRFWRETWDPGDGKGSIATGFVLSVDW